MWIEKTIFTMIIIKKYHKYFEEWISGITSNQIDGMREQMIGMITQSKIKH